MRLRPKARRDIGRRAALAGAGSLLAFPAGRVQAQTAGVALVIGNSRYQWEAPLPNVRRDAPDIARRFQALGLQTELIQDVGRDAMLQAIDKFAAASRGANLAALYFAGHGASWAKDTYLVPIDTDLSTPSVVQSLIPVPSISAAMKGAANRLLVLDNCRNNPAEGWRQLEAERSAAVGDAQRESAARVPNTLTLFSTAPGRIALDGPAGENSPFAATLLRQLEGQSIDLQALAPKLRRDLLIATQGRQVLWDRNSFQQSFLLNGGRGSAAPANRSGWSQDPSNIIELNNAYAFAQQNGLTLPPGLIAHRPANNSPDSLKVGSFQYVAQSPVGTNPQVLVVMSVEEKRTAELIVAGKSNNGSYWRFVTGTLSGNRLEYVPRDGAARFMFDWSDANSGSLSQILESGKGGKKNAAYNTRFSRLDG
jgi:hypothetical protein